MVPRPQWLFRAFSQVMRDRSEVRPSDGGAEWLIDLFHAGGADGAIRAALHGRSPWLLGVGRALLPSPHPAYAFVDPAHG